ncbi:hypothetical protein EYF80_024652 [Liparis tanakae]|uniref:Uncharacterized protein n=1 Tax=Liparis tanakae TaxID=230148 RepID=A0A4Z2HJN2_9TELE|nr:hypothetical protein EYF80_024652 [Liparis tanakae]
MRKELAELSALGISGAQALFWCHHCADAAPIGILGRAVHLPALLWPDILFLISSSSVAMVRLMAVLRNAIKSGI